MYRSPRILEPVVISRACSATIYYEIKKACIPCRMITIVVSIYFHLGAMKPRRNLVEAWEIVKEM